MRNTTVLLAALVLAAIGCRASPPAFDDLRGALAPLEPVHEDSTPDDGAAGERDAQTSPLDENVAMVAEGQEPVPSVAEMAADGTRTGEPSSNLDEPSSVLTLDDLLRSVDESFPLLTAARQERLIAEAKRLRALGAFDLTAKAGASVAPEGFYTNRTARLGLEQPTTLWGTSLFGGYRFGVGDFDPTFDGKRVTNYGGEFGLGFSVPLLRGGPIDPARRDLRVAEIGREVANNEVRSRRLEFVLEATQLYWDWVAAGRRLEIAERLLAFAADRQEGVARRVESGDLPPVEEIDNERLIVKREAVLVSIRRDLQRAAFALSLFLRDASGQPIVPRAEELPEVFPDPSPSDAGDLEASLERAASLRPDLAQLRQKWRQIEVETELLENQLLPRVDLGLFASQDVDRTRPSRTKGEFELTAALELSFPVQNRQAKGELRRLRGERTQLLEELRYLEDRVRTEVLDAHSAVVATFDLVQAARRTADLTEQLASAERRRFELGDSNVLVLNLREQDAAEAELEVIESLKRHWAAVAEYRAASGELVLP